MVTDHRAAAHTGALVKTRPTRLGALLLLLASCWLLLAPYQVGGLLTYVTTEGASMAPRLQTGDLAVLRPTREYAVGDVAAYRSPMLDRMVIHRIVAVDDGTYTFRGDNNSWLDPETLTQDDMAGKLLLRIPHGGELLDLLMSPPALGLITFALIVTGGTAVRTRRTRRSRRTQTMRDTSAHRSLTIVTPAMRTATAAAAAAGLAGIALGAFTWVSPPPEPPAHDVAAPQSMTFSYETTVPDSPAYDDTTVTSPEPVFRKLADTVEVHLAYRGEPGTMAVHAQLSSANGWTSRVRLSERTAFWADEYDATVTLDLDALERRGRAAGKAIGIPTEELGIEVVPTVRGQDGGTFSPGLSLSLTPLRLVLAGEPTTLSVADAPAPPATDDSAEGLTVPVLGSTLPTQAGRLISAALVLAALLTAGALAVSARRSTARTEAGAILHRYGHLLAPVHPMPTPAGRPVVDVTDFPTLARLAERHGLLVLHWSRSDVTTFVVQDEGATYRYRTTAGPAPAEQLPAGPDELAQPTPR